jgi:transcriptional regulator with XRE-family HTH domain
MARAALGWTTSELAKAAKVGISTVNRFETDQAVPIPATLTAIQRALEDAGIIFLDDGETNDGGPGVRLKKVQK